MPTRREFLMQTAVATVAGAVSERAAQGAERKDPAAVMKSYRIPHTDLVVSRIAYGTAMSAVSWRSSDLFSKSVQAIHTAYENGITFFDTADIYAGGQSEAALGEFLKHSPGLRDRVVIQTKCGSRLPRGWVPGEPLSPDSFGLDLRRDHILSAVEGSLKRLGTDRLDVLLLHGHDALVEPEEVAEAFDQLKNRGKVRYFGVSNHNATQIELLKGYVRQPLVANQMRLGLAYYSQIADRSSFGGLVNYCRAREIQVQAHSPLMGTALFGKPPLLNPPADATAEIKQAAAVLMDIANKHEVTPAAVMIAWLLRHPAGIVPIVGASQTQHIVDNCAADRVALSHEQWNTLFNATATLQSA